MDLMCNKQMAGLPISDHPRGPSQVLVFSHTFAKVLISSLMFQTQWLPFIPFQSGSPVMVAGLWKAKVEIPGQGNYFCHAGEVGHLPFLLLHWGPGSDPETKGQEIIPSKEIQSVSLGPGKLKITYGCPDESRKTQSTGVKLQFTLTVNWKGCPAIWYLASPSLYLFKWNDIQELRLQKPSPARKTGGLSSVLFSFILIITTWIVPASHTLITLF